MTSDAKVGLLLALVFIIVITFIINGWPGLGRNAEKAQAQTRYMPGANRDTNAIGAIAHKIAPRLNRITAVSKEKPDKTEEIRYKAKPPMAEKVIKNTISTDTGQSDTVIEVPAKMHRPEPRQNTLKTYVVESGDNLASIAKKFYGDEDGNKMANILKIFNANRNKLKTVDMIFEGQKIVIPSLLTAETLQPVKETFKSKSIFTPVKNVARKLAVRSEEPARPSVYVVKQGDCLWAIANEQLGDGSRYSEIIRLNRDIIDDEDSLEVSMRLRLPEK